MDCVNEDGAKKLSSEKNKELSGRKVVEVASNIEYKVVRVFYEAGEVFKKKVMSYPVFVSLSNGETKEKIKLEQFEKKYNLVD